MLVLGAGLQGLLNALGDSLPMVLVIVLALAAAGGVWALFRWFLRWREKGKSLPFMGKLMRAAGGAPQGVAADPAKRARLDDLRKKFEEGVEKFRAAGKNIYGLPWYLLVGPSGAGKTEAIRHCNVGFPPGLQDYLQGAGGTLNMHWWFTNHAVILDTAGKMFMEEVGAGESSEWKEFLKLLRDSRTLQPINGMLLCIGVDSLIKDSADEIQEKAGKIARQLDLIQRTLDVRFPVYVLVTKCDLITGFREFFEKFSGPGVQDQMLGWSNPAALDEPFQPDKVGQYIESVRERLVRRRFTHLVDPVHTDDPQARRTDQVDSLFALPDSLARLSSRLRRYLELIFVAGEWSPKPLFLRGIYFTSSMRQGAELDEEVAKILGMSVDALPGGGMTEEKSYFLRDVFTSKVFKERGLVTRATNVTKQQRRRKLALVGTGIAAVLLLSIFTVSSYLDFRASIDRSRNEWAAVARGHKSLSLLVEGRPGQPAFNQDKPVEIGSKELGAAEVVALTSALAEQPPSVPFVLRPLSWTRLVAGSSLESEVRRAHEAVLFDAVVSRIVNQARERLLNKAAGNPWAGQDAFSERAATGVLAGLLALERRSAPPAPSPDGKGGGPDAPLSVDYPLDMNKFCAFLLPADWSAENKAKAGPVHDAARTIQEVFERTYGDGSKSGWAKWPPEGERFSLGKDTLPAVRAGVEQFIEYWKSGAAVDRKLGALGTLKADLEAFNTAEQALAEQARRLEQHNTTPNTIDGFRTIKAEWDAKSAAMEAARKAVEVDLGKITNLDDVQQTIETIKKVIKDDAGDSFRAIMGEPPLDAKTKATMQRLAAEQGATATQALAAGVSMLTKWPGETEDLHQKLLNAKAEIIDKDAIGDKLKPLSAYFTTGDGRKLLARSGGADGKRAFQIRAEVYAELSRALAFGEDEFRADRAPKFGGLAGADQAVESAMKGMEGKVAALVASPSVEPPAVGADKVGGVGAVFRAARRQANYRVVESAMAGQTPSALEDWAMGQVKTLEASLKEKPVAQKVRDSEGVALLAKDASSPNPAFSPDAAKVFFADMKYLMRVYPRTGPLGDAYEDVNVRNTARLAYDSTRAFAARYKAYWSKDLVERVAIDAPGKWTEYKARLGELNRNEDGITTRLRQLGDGAAAALGVEGLGEALDEGSSKEGNDRLLWAAALSKTDSSDALKKYLAPWRALPDNEIDAMNVIGDLPKEQFQTDYLQGLECAGPDKRTSPLARYLDGLRLRALEAIAADVEAGRRTAAPRPLPPLRFEPEAGGRWQEALSRDDIRKIRNYNFAGGTVPGAGNAAAVRNSVPSISPDCVKALLARMFDSKGASITDAQRKALERWIPFVLGDGTDAGELRFRIQTLPPSAVTARFDGVRVEGSSSAHYKANCVEVGLGPKTERANETEEPRTLCDWTPLSLDQRLKFAFRASCDVPGGEYGQRTLHSAWAVLELLAEPESLPIDSAADGNAPDGVASRAWAVPVKVKAADGKVWHKWLRIEFNVAVPARKTWPDRRVWGE